MEESRIIQVTESIFSENERVAKVLRQKFADSGVLVLNLVSSPGSGKTTILERTAMDLKSELKMGVIEGDQQTSNDADRIARTGIFAQQINTMSGCHLDAPMIDKALRNFDLDNLDVLFIENVGNLVCPAEFDLGEDFRVLALSITEGEDKPIKYPLMFMSAQTILVNKIDLLSILGFKMEECSGYIKRINPNAMVFELSARSGEGMENWYQWLRQAVQTKKAGKK
ncbi:Hydrogenase maturation factor HypB [Sporomusa silvacetica DSM 10669]|uniref:Hydrogenase maturation factor HypB n=1 Tax=Sporomusa silvacetica DSM 10669 TaxID=1123289 RepID=A0ABZ3ILE7_9FIRM|nr:hydrogenase nickel incorporation protein HypB [Sporomusa silvacetica]OZC13446.1 hydrogenase isoenzymes nickel incorporation protein HypB [Sporomusa silvacetica DSM 10669]